MARMIPRYNESERANHWMVALLFMLAALSGLAFFRPAFYFLTALFGGGSWARILHPFVGVLMCLSFLGLFMRLKGDNVLNEGDRAWRAKSAELLAGNKAAMPPAGKYNAAQKITFWVKSLCLLVLLVTGVMFWEPWFAHYFPIWAMRLAVLLHSVSATVLILTVIMHIYAAIWVKGSMRAMTRGDVTEGWAKQNHALWYEQVSRGK